ncbi:MAG: hypothetical protein EOT04_03035, partial [Candidatus Chaera renei]
AAGRLGWLPAANLPAIPSAPPGSFRVVSFADGDTISVAMNGRIERIRLIGVDTPETAKNGVVGQCYAQAAAAFTRDQIKADGSIRLQADPIGDNRDRYGRLLRYVYLPDGSQLNRRLIEEGYGFAYLFFPFSQSADFAAAQNQARQNGKGLWSNCRPYQKKGKWQTQIIGTNGALLKTAAIG